MKAKLFTSEGALKGDIELPEEAFGGDINKHVLHQVITSYQANARQGTAKTKGRSEVSGGGKKPWKQKGTGRARSGANTSPIWVRGGKAFGANPRDYSTTIPRKMRKKALQSALACRAQDEKVLVVESITLDAPKTKPVASLLQAMNVTGLKTLLVIDSENSNVYLSGRNIKNVTVKSLGSINARDILVNDTLVFGDEKLIDKVKEVVAL